MITPTLNLEKELWNKGFSHVCGLDEVGRGCFAGPVAVGAVIFPPGVVLPEGVADSKLLTPKKREKLAEQIKEVALAWKVAVIDVSHINEFGIGEATQMAFRKALRLLEVKVDFALIDAFFIKQLSRDIQKAVQGGDKICASISAASIIAKVFRDALMADLHQKYPLYGFDKHKGYGTKDHRDAIKKYGLCEIHRTSFDLKKFL